MRRAANTLHLPWYSLTDGKLSAPLIDTVITGLIDCFGKYESYPQVRVGTDSQKTRGYRYQFSALVVLHYKNYYNRIYYTKFLQNFQLHKKHLRTDVAGRDQINIKRLTNEGKITIAIAEALSQAIAEKTTIPGLSLQLHFDYNLDETYISNNAYHAIQSLIHSLDFSYEALYKPHAMGATKAADRIIRK